MSLNKSMPPGEYRVILISLKRILLVETYPVLQLWIELLNLLAVSSKVLVLMFLRVQPSLLLPLL